MRLRAVLGEEVYEPGEDEGEEEGEEVFEQVFTAPSGASLRRLFTATVVSSTPPRFQGNI